jgi:integrase
MHYRRFLRDAAFGVRSGTTTARSQSQYGKPPRSIRWKNSGKSSIPPKMTPNLELAELVLTITRNTSASGCELRLSRLDSVDLTSTPPVFRVSGDVTKNDIRPRIIPLNADALEAFRRALGRATKLGSHLPGHYIFPFRVNKAKWDPNRPASKSWLRKQTARLRERTGIKHIKPHTWRHQLCTENVGTGRPRGDGEGRHGMVLKANDCNIFAYQACGKGRCLERP